MVYDKLACHHPAKPASADIKSEIRLRHWRHSAFCILFLACVFSMNLSLNAALLSLFILCFDIRRNEASWRACVRVCVCSCYLLFTLFTSRNIEADAERAHQRQATPASSLCFQVAINTVLLSGSRCWLHHWKNTGYKLQSNFPRFGPLNTCICQLKAKISYINRNSFPESWKYCNGWIIDWS